MKPRMKSPLEVIPNVNEALQGLGKALFTSAAETDIPRQILFLCYLRASQINGDSVCVQLHATNAKNEDASPEKVLAVAAWRETPFFSEAERAALALVEAVTRLSDQSNPVTEETYLEAARHYEEKALATLIAGIATVNLFNRLNVATRQIVQGPQT
ncbi:carboxymuconolactone decarboxylase family protein [Halalkalibacter oceani]|uniref:Carboxymuconolactone decarboxylase family protein n=1 Tax=Halalkalibacter oceani TaxID=1653776 RepID=A0A9X2DPB3_9BACI|nr:carboxymuconolactone decarboxylase family protein [Halalkalibacter oceani]MCM3714434.1 carboxymuconolactone decarboxylase family protein [Halalkalibacter oceani]